MMQTEKVYSAALPKISDKVEERIEKAEFC